MIGFLQLCGGLITWGLIYGWCFRPWITRQRIFNSTQEIPGGEALCIRLDCDSPRLLDLMHEVDKGAAVTVVVATADDIRKRREVCMHLPEASSFSSLYGKRRVIIPEGRWAILVTPHSPSDTESSLVKVQVSVARRPSFVPETECNFLQLRKPVEVATDDESILDLVLTFEASENTAVLV